MTKRQCYANGVPARAALTLLAILVVTGCAALRPKPPTLAVAGVGVDRLAPADARFSVYVAMGNPNDRAIAVDAIVATLRIEDVMIGRARLAEPVTLPARGEATARLVAQADLPSSVRAAAQVASRLLVEGDAFAGIRYAVDGTATIDGGSVYPFSRSGEIAWKPR